MNWKPIFAFLLLDSFLLLICQGNVQVSVRQPTFLNFLRVEFYILFCLKKKRKWISLCQLSISHAIYKIVICKNYNFSFPISTLFENHLKKYNLYQIDMNFHAPAGGLAVGAEGELL